VEDFGGRDKNEILDDIGADRGGRDVRRECAWNEPRSGEELRRKNPDINSVRKLAI